MKQVAAEPLQYEFSRHATPRAVIASGETLVVEAEDALSGQIRRPGDRRDKSLVPYSNPVAGPIVVSGAEPGDALEVSIEAIEPRDGQCATYTGGPGPLAEWLGTDPPHGAHVCPIQQAMVHWSEQVRIPYQPMLGCIGTAPDWGSPSTAGAGNHGGNLDLKEVCPGHRVTLPVFVPGGFLYLGDAHAAMGHGELSATGLEMASISRIRVELVKGGAPPGPRIESPAQIMAVAAMVPLERSIAQAFARLILWMESNFGWDRWRAYDLLTHVAEISIGHYAVGAVAAKIDRSYLPLTS
jgi:acetamidase/formamidase